MNAIKIEKEVVPRMTYRIYGIEKEPRYDPLILISISLFWNNDDDRNERWW